MSARTSVPEKVVVAILGSLNADLVVRTSRQPSAGETLTAKSLTIGCGGKGANQAIAVRRMTARKRDESQVNARSKTEEAGKQSGSNNDNDAIDIETRMIGAVGDDAFGKKLVQQLGEADGVDISGVQVLDQVETGSAVITVDDEGQNSIMVVPGANGRFGIVEEDRGGSVEKIARPVVVVKGDEDVLVCQLEVNKDVVFANLEAAKKNGSYTVLNPSPAVQVPLSLLTSIDFLILNETETAILSNLPPSALSADADPARFFDLAERLTSAGVGHVIITRGPHGSIYLSKSDNGSQQRRLVIPAAPVKKVIDTTCAGDTFLGTFVAVIASAIGRHRKQKVQKNGGSDTEIAATKIDVSTVIEDALKLAHAAAAMAVQQDGAIDSIPFGHRLESDFPDLMPLYALKL